MTNDPVVSNALPSTAAEAASGTRSSSDAERQRIKALAQEFEALLMTQMLREMRRAMLSDEGDKDGLGHEAMTDTIDIELGRALSRAGGLGLTGVLFKAIERRLGDGTRPPPSAPSGPPSPDQPVAGAMPVPVEPVSASSWAAPPTDESEIKVPQGRVSSAFGWRPDPFTGSLRFHRGIDVAQAYGHDVRAAAAGQVAFAGDHGAFGTTIVIEHPGGRRTRYAHLSASGVQPGDRVDAGQVIGQSGSSGRSTGPHLHFEVLDAGRPVDPAAGA